MIDKKLGFGIIGCGMIANWHADAIKQIDRAQLIGVTDINDAAREAFSKKYGIKSFESMEALLASPEVDVVCVCTPSGLHAPIAIKVANAGKHIIIEKPMAITTQECDDIIKACETNKVKMAVISQLRFTDAIQRLKDAVNKNLLGRLIMGDIYMKYYRSPEYYKSGGWKGTKKMDGGGALMNQGIHGIDLLQYVMGPVKTVFGHAKTLSRNIEVEDTASALLEFENGALGVIQGTTSIYPGYSRRLEVNGDKGSIIVEEDTILSWDIEGQERPKDLNIGRSAAGSASNPAAFSVDGHIKQISDMVDAIIYDRKPLVDQYEGKKPVEIILAIYESSQTGKIVRL
ncbi:MAG TPA: Gfo/Idh/MocA family oxidoreductase [Clostridiaceae bacterium]|nr:Gfo/Idh/MocA family oxidoreductase [Clostridiaceae bacterium]